MQGFKVNQLFHVLSGFPLPPPLPPFPPSHPLHPPIPLSHHPPLPPLIFSPSGNIYIISISSPNFQFSLF